MVSIRCRKLKIRCLQGIHDKRAALETVTFAGVFNNQDEPFLSGYLPKVPPGRMAREDEYKGAILFLASGASSYMTRSNLVIDDGWTAW